MEVQNLPPHKAAAAKKIAEQEKAELDAIVDNLPPHKAAAVRKMTEKKKQADQDLITDQAQAAEAISAHQHTKPEMIQTQQSLSQPPPPSPPTTSVVVQGPVRVQKAKEVIVLEEEVTTVTDFRDVAVEKEHDMTVALTDIEEIKRDIAIAKMVQSSQTTAPVLHAATVAGEVLLKISSQATVEKTLPAEASLRLHVENIHPDIMQQELEEIFGSEGPVALIKLEQGHAQVLYHNLAHAAKAVEHFNAKHANGQRLSVVFTKNPRRLTFHEGNHQTPFECVESLLKHLGLWRIVSKPRPEIQELQMQVKDAWAVNHILSYVCKEFLERRPIDRNISGFQLLEHLRTACRA